MSKPNKFRAKNIFREICGDYPLDAWGCAMGAFFDVCAALYERPVAIPHVWGYRPGAGGAPTIEDEYTAELLSECTDAELLRLGEFCHRLTARIDRAGLSY